MDPREFPRRTLVAHAREEAFAPGTRSILAKLGYRILMPDELREQAAAHPNAALDPELRIVEERRLSELGEESHGDGSGDDPNGPVPIVLLTGRHGVTDADPRIVGAVKRPAGLHDLFRVLQQIFEENPRSTPRVPVHLRAQCAGRGADWPGVVLSLSENGCLLRSPETVPLGRRIQLSFRLPQAGAVEVEAETAYQLLPDLGLVFSAIAPDARDAIAGYVADALGQI